MSYESFRVNIAEKLLLTFDNETLKKILTALDETASGYEISRKCTDLITYEGIPNLVQVYIAAKSVENLAKGTLKNYYLNLCHFFRSIRMPLEQVTANDVRMYLHNYKITRHVQDSTIEGLRRCLHGFFDWCTDEEYIPKNPTKRIMPNRVADNQRLPMNTLELERVRCACKTLREKALVDFLFSTACRVSECSHMNLDCINFTDRTVKVEHGKGGKSRVTFLNAEAEVSLKAYLATRNDDSPAVFVSGRAPHDRLGAKAIQNEIDRIVSRVELSVHVTPHIFRHTAASLALQRGMPIEQVQKFLGHSKIQTTLRYAKVLDFDVKQSHQRYIA